MNRSVKYLIITTALLLCTFLFATGVFSANIILAESASVTVQCAADGVVTLEFTPSSNGAYVFASKGDVDTVGALFTEQGYASSSAPMAEDDDSGTDRNFEIVAQLNASEKYYISVAVLDEGGSFEVSAKKMETVSEGSSSTVFLSKSVSDAWLLFKPSANGVYKISSVSTGVDPLCIVYDQYGRQISYNDDGEAGLDFTVGCSMSAGTAYYIKVSQYGSENGSVTVSLQRHTNGWLLSDGIWAYYSGGVRSGSGWKQNKNSWCYIGTDGFAITNQWKNDSRGDVYLDETGLMVTNSIIESDVGTYYVNENGYCIKNKWIVPEDKRDWMFFGNDGKLVVSSWLMDSNGWCYVGADGCLVRNAWVKDGQEWCYLDSSGRITKNKWIKDSIGWCYLGSNGYCVKNAWIKDSIGWCYLDSTGRMATDCWVRDSAGWCYVGSNGYAVTNCWIRDSVGWCYINANGYMVKNTWINDNGYWYYLDSNGYMVTGTTTINGTTYTFKSNGVWLG